jgi:hypothetical protein
LTADVNETSNEDFGVMDALLSHAESEEEDEDEDTAASDAACDEEPERARLFAPQEQPAVLPANSSATDKEEIQLPLQNAAAPQGTSTNGYQGPHIFHYGRSAGSPVLLTDEPSSDEAYRSTLSEAGGNNPFYPFSSKLEGEFEEWAKLHGSNISASAVTDLISIAG